MNLDKYIMKALKYGVNMAKQRCPYSSVRGHQTDPSECPLSSPPRDRRAPYLCTKNSIIRHDGWQAIYIYITSRCAVGIRVNDRQDHRKCITFES